MDCCLSRVCAFTASQVDLQHGYASASLTSSPSNRVVALRTSTTRKKKEERSSSPSKGPHSPLKKKRVATVKPPRLLRTWHEGRKVLSTESHTASKLQQLKLQENAPGPEGWRGEQPLSDIEQFKLDAIYSEEEEFEEEEEEEEEYIEEEKEEEEENLYTFFNVKSSDDNKVNPLHDNPASINLNCVHFKRCVL